MRLSFRHGERQTGVQIRQAHVGKADRGRRKEEGCLVRVRTQGERYLVEVQTCTVDDSLYRTAFA